MSNVPIVSNPARSVFRHFHDCRPAFLQTAARIPANAGRQSWECRAVWQGYSFPISSAVSMASSRITTLVRCSS